jgi:hypothetical protein
MRPSVEAASPSFSTTSAKSTTLPRTTKVERQALQTQ